MFCCVDFNLHLEFLEHHYIGLSRTCQQEVNVFPFPAPSLTVFLLTGAFHKGPVLVPFCISSTLQSYLTSLNVTFQILNVMWMIHKYICLSSPMTLSSQEDAITAMQNCIDDIHSSMEEDKLLLNNEKTEFLVIGTRRQLSKVNISSIIVGNSAIMKSSVVRNPGSYIDDKLSMNSHINKVCNASFYYLHNIRRIRKHLS